MQNEYKTIIVEKRDDIAIIYINRPEVMNAVNQDLGADLHAVFDALKWDEDLSVVILTGKGAAFVGGADLVYVQNLDQKGAYKGSYQGQELMKKLEAFPHPIIAAINGMALGGGAELAWACDIRIASTQAIFAQPEVALGFNLGWGGTQRLPYLIGRGRAMELMLTAAPIDAQKALEWVLVNKVAAPDQLMDEAIKMAKNIARNSKNAVTYTKKAVVDGYRTGGNSMELEAELWGLSFVTDEPRTRVKAFLQKLLGKKQS